jgi:5-methylcytosine-specific restriction enzyme subunit McrC
MATDVCLARPGRAIILDTKFYTEALKANAYGSAKLSAANFYQLFTYLRQRAHMPGWEQAEGVLLYPRTLRDFDAKFTTQGHRVRALTLDLSRPWPDIHAALLSIALPASTEGPTVSPMSRGSSQRMRS